MRTVWRTLTPGLDLTHADSTSSRSIRRASGSPLGRPQGASRVRRPWRVGSTRPNMVRDAIGLMAAGRDGAVSVKVDRVPRAFAAERPGPGPHRVSGGYAALGAAAGSGRDHPGFGDGLLD